MLIALLGVLLVALKEGLGPVGELGEEAGVAGLVLQEVLIAVLGFCEICS